MGEWKRQQPIEPLPNRPSMQVGGESTLGTASPCGEAKSGLRFCTCKLLSTPSFLFSIFFNSLCYLAFSGLCGLLPVFVMSQLLFRGSLQRLEPRAPMV